MGNPEEAALADYPTRWSAYIGQEVAKARLRKLAQSCRMRGAQMPHILITCSIPGVGKTALAWLTARAIGAPVHFVSGQMSADAAEEFFADVSDGDTVIYDEFHKIMDNGRKNAEWMLHYLLHGVLVTPYGMMDVPKVTFIATTTEKSDLMPALRDRFRVIDLHPYSVEEGAQIAAGMAANVLGTEGLPLLSLPTATAVAVAAMCQPRRMNELLECIRDMAVIGDIDVPTDGDYDMGAVLAFAGVTSDGLTDDLQAYLRVIHVDMIGRPTSEAVLSQRLGLKKPELMRLERTLLDLMYLVLTPKGRKLTPKGRQRARQLFTVADPAFAMSEV